MSKKVKNLKNETMHCIMTNITDKVLSEGIRFTESNQDGVFTLAMVAEMDILPSHDEIKGCDYVEGYFRDSRVWYCNLVLETLVYTSGKGDNGGGMELVPMFQGPVMIFERDRDFGGSLQIKPLETWRGRNRKAPLINLDKNQKTVSTLKTSDEEFNHWFDVTSDNDLWAMSLLTDKFIARLRKWGAKGT